MLSSSVEESRTAILRTNQQSNKEQVIDILIQRLTIPDGPVGSITSIGQPPRAAALDQLRQLEALKAVTPALRLVCDSDERIRLKALNLLIQLHPKTRGKTKTEILQAIETRLHDCVQNVQIAAINAIKTLQYKPALKTLLELLGKNHQLVNPLTETLIVLQPREAIPELLHIMETQQPIRPKIGEILVSLGKPVVKPLIILLEKTDNNLRYQILNVAIQLKDKRFLDPALDILQETGNPSLKQVIISALKAIPDAYQALLKRLLDDPNNANLADAITHFPLRFAHFIQESRGKYKDVEFLSALVDIQVKVEARSLTLFNSGNPQERRMAAEVFRILEKQQAIQPLIKALSDKDEGVRCEAAKTLLHYKAPLAVETILLRLPQESNPEVVCAFLVTLQKNLPTIAPNPQLKANIIETIHPLVIRGSPEVRIEAIEVLAVYSAHSGDILAEEISSALVDFTLEVKLKAITKLGEILTTETEVIKRLKEETEVGNPQIREKAETAIGLILERNIVTLATESASNAQLIKALDAIALTGNSHALSVIEALFARIHDIEVWVAALNAIREMGTSEYLPLLEQLQRDQGDPKLKEAISAAITQIRQTKTSDSEMELLRKGETPITEQETLRILQRDSWSWLPKDGESVISQLTGALEHFVSGKYSECITKLNNVCEILVLQLLAARKTEIGVTEPKYQRLVKDKHWNRLGAIREFIGPKLEAELKSIHQSRLEADTAHAGKQMTWTEAAQVIRTFREVVFAIEAKMTPS